VECFDITIPSEVPIIERQNSFNAMYSHGRHQSRIVNLNAGDIVRDEQATPFLVNRQIIG